MFSGVEVKLDDRFDSTAADDARRAKGDVVKTILAAHQSRNNEDRALVTEDGFADARDAGGNGETGVALKGSHYWASVAHGN